jgi:hypothetical protein
MSKVAATAKFAIPAREDVASRSCFAACAEKNIPNAIALRSFNVTAHPSDTWIAQQLRQATPYGQIPVSSRSQ